MLGSRLAQHNSLASRATGKDRAIGPLLIVATGLLMIGWFAPMMTVSQFLLLEKNISIFNALVIFAKHNEYFLLVIVLIFPVLFPALKIVFSYLLWYRYDSTMEYFQLHIKYLQTIGKWSMVDVFLVALVFASIKINIIGNVYLHWGIYCFTGSIILSMIIVTRLATLALQLPRHLRQKH